MWAAGMQQAFKYTPKWVQMIHPPARTALERRVRETALVPHTRRDRKRNLDAIARRAILREFCSLYWGPQAFQWTESKAEARKALEKVTQGVTEKTTPM